jgi:hypothetical protein
LKANDRAVNRTARVDDAALDEPTVTVAIGPQLPEEGEQRNCAYQPKRQNKSRPEFTVH